MIGKRSSINGFAARAGRELEEFDRVIARSMGSIDKAAQAGVDATLGTFGRLSVGAGAEFDKIKVASASAFAGITDSAKVSADAAITNIGRITAAAEASAAKMRGLGEVGSGVRMLERRSLGASHAGGIHLRGHGVSVPGGHAGFSGDGTTEAVGAFGIFEMMKGSLERGLEMDKISSQYLASGFNSAQIAAAKQAAWMNTRTNPNATAIDSFADILELNKATGNLGESMETLPAISRVDTLLKSIKGKGLDANYNREGQILNYAKGLRNLVLLRWGRPPKNVAVTSRLIRPS